MSWDRHLHRPARRTLAVLATTAAAAAIAGPAPAAPPACAYDGGSHTLYVGAAPTYTEVRIWADPTAAEPPLMVDAWNDGDFQSITCDGATLENTDLVVAQGAGGELQMDASNAAFAPIHFSVAGFASIVYSAPLDRPLTLNVGSKGLAFDGDGDLDVAVSDESIVWIDGPPLDTTLTAMGGGGSGKALPKAVELVFQGGDGHSNPAHDVIVGHNGADYIHA